MLGCALQTTHSMEEAEALCSRIGIMAHGTLRCLGTLLRLKSVYGKGFKLTLSCKPGQSDKAAAFVEPLFPGMWTKLDNFTTNVSYEFQPAPGLIPRLFDEIQRNKADHGIEDWGISQTTLEEVFLRIIRGKPPHRQAAGVAAQPALVHRGRCRARVIRTARGSNLSRIAMQRCESGAIVIRKEAASPVSVIGERSCHRVSWPPARNVYAPSVHARSCPMFAAPFSTMLSDAVALRDKIEQATSLATEVAVDAEEAALPEKAHLVSTAPGQASRATFPFSP